MNNNINVPVMNNQNQKLKVPNNKSKTTSEDILHLSIEEVSISDYSEHWEKAIFKLSDEIRGKPTLVNEAKEDLVVVIPKKDNPRYKQLEKYNESHFSYNRVAVELLIRNKEFISTLNDLNEAERVLEANDFCNDDAMSRFKEAFFILKQDFGYDISDKIKLYNLPYFNKKLTKLLDDYYLINNPPYINDLENGINKVINYYFNKRKLYLLRNPIYVEIENLSENEAKYFKDDIYVKIDEDNYVSYKFFLQNTSNIKRLDDKFYDLKENNIIIDSEEEISKIKNNKLLAIKIKINEQEFFHPFEDGNLSIEFLDKDFIASIPEVDKLKLISQIQRKSDIQVNIPILNIDCSKYVNILINLDTPDEILLKDIKLLKESKSKIKTINEVLNGEKEKTNSIKFKKSLKLSSQVNQIKESLYLYDICEIIMKEAKEKQNKIEEEIKKNTSNQKYIKTQTSLYDENEIYKALSKHLKIKPATIKEKVSLITELLKKENIQNIILGNVN